VLETLKMNLGCKLSKNMKQGKQYKEKSENKMAFL
jgi:hypothetical protein